MKPRHVAALALIGWYLMCPPIRNGRILRDAPIKEWTNLGLYKHLEHCQHQKKADSTKNNWVMPETATTLQDLRLEECIATDDPRLAQ